MKRIFIILLALLPGLVFADTVKVSWNANPEPDLSGYIVYYGTSPGNYSHSILVKNATNYNVIIFGGGTYYFAVTAIDSSNNESDFSEEKSIALGSSDDLTEPSVWKIYFKGFGVPDSTIEQFIYQAEDLAFLDGYVAMNEGGQSTPIIRSNLSVSGLASATWVSTLAGKYEVLAKVLHDSQSSDTFTLNFEGFGIVRLSSDGTDLWGMVSFGEFELSPGDVMTITGKRGSSGSFARIDYLEFRK